MQKKVFALALVLMLAVASVASAVTLTPVLENVRRPDYVDESEFIIAQDADSRLYGVYNTAGEVVVPFEYGYMDDEKFGHFEVINEEGLNNHALVNGKGEKVIDFQYAAFEIISPKYCAAVTLEPTDGEVYDYAGGFAGNGEHYLVTAYDIYDLTTGSRLGSLERSQYERAAAHGDYLWVEDREGNIAVYDSTLARQDVQAKYLTSAYETVSGDCVAISNGQVVLENCSSVSEDSDTQTLRVWRDGKVGLCDLNGNMLIPAEYDSVGIVRLGYAPVEQGDLYGLYDINAGKLVVPCQYTDVPYTMAGGIARYECNGYVLVQQDEKYGFCDLNGNVTCEIKYAKNAVTLHGASFSVTDMDGSLYLVAADGVQTKLEGVTEINKYSGGLGDLLIATKGDKSGVIDWHGEEVLPFEYASYDLSITDSGSAVIVDETVYAVAR